MLRALYRRRRVLALLAVLVSTAAAYFGAFWLRFAGHWPTEFSRVFLVTGVILLILRGIVAVPFHLHNHRWRYSSTRDLVEIMLATGSSTVVFWTLIQILPLAPKIPHSVILLETILVTYFLAGSRLIYRLCFEWIQRRRGRPGSDPLRRVLIVGAGEAGNLISREMCRYPEFGFDIVGFVDDDRAKAESRLNGVQVLGTTADIPSIVERWEVDEIVFAIPSALPTELRQIVDVCEYTRVKLTILPHEGGALAGQVSLSQLRDVRIEDLLAREPVRLQLPELAEDLGGESVLITGAAGSIGAELARQVALHGPAVLVLLDQAETPLFYLDMELHARHPELHIVAAVGDILDDGRLAELLQRHSPTRIYHAAAYKHVPLMEANPSEVLRNNVVGSWKVAEAAGKVGTEKFVLISTDKAVNPSCMMGRTKRAAELVLLSCAQRYPRTHYTAVRFGNVLGSQGSVIPIFRRQLAAGLPLTVTHTDVTRYFMTIPEAVQLVLEASLLPEARGHITMLDMGEPMRILAMARHFLRLAGVAHPDERIKITGLRPGEKMHEELTFAAEKTFASAHAKVRVVERGEASGWRRELMASMKELRLHADTERDAALLERVWVECSRAAVGGKEWEPVGAARTKGRDGV